MKVIPGVLWEFDHVRWLYQDEYEWLMRNPWPCGWSILVAPQTEFPAISPTPTSQGAESAALPDSEKPEKK